jgi:hypothetical protein
MTEPQSSTIEASATTYESLEQALDGLERKFELPEAARQFVKRGAATARDRSTDLRAGVHKVNGATEDAIIRAVSGLAEINRKVVEAAYQDTEATLSAMDRMADAKSLSEAYQVYVDYLRQQREVGIARAKRAAEFVSAKASEGFHALQDAFANNAAQ